MHRCLCPGSFDPVTHGHLDVITRAASLFDEVVVAVLANPAKRSTFSADDRVDMLIEALEGTPGAERTRVTAPAHGLLADLARELGASALVKGVRGGSDVEHESSMAQMNRHLGVETVLLLADQRWAHVSSSLVKEVATLGGDVSAFVPAGVAARLRARVD